MSTNGIFDESIFKTNLTPMCSCLVSSFPNDLIGTFEGFSWNTNLLDNVHRLFFEFLLLKNNDSVHTSQIKKC